MIRTSKLVRAVRKSADDGMTQAESSDVDLLFTTMGKSSSLLRPELCDRALAEAASST